MHAPPPASNHAHMRHHAEMSTLLMRLLVYTARHKLRTHARHSIIGRSVYPERSPGSTYHLAPLRSHMPRPPTRAPGSSPTYTALLPPCHHPATSLPPPFRLRTRQSQSRGVTGSRHHTEVELINNLNFEGH